MFVSKIAEFGRKNTTRRGIWTHSEIEHFGPQFSGFCMPWTIWMNHWIKYHNFCKVRKFEQHNDSSNTVIFQNAELAKHLYRNNFCWDPNKQLPEIPTIQGPIASMIPCRLCWCGSQPHLAPGWTFVWYIAWGYCEMSTKTATVLIYINLYTVVKPYDSKLNRKKKKQTNFTYSLHVLNRWRLTLRNWQFFYTIASWISFTFHKMLTGLDARTQPSPGISTFRDLSGDK